MDIAIFFYNAAVLSILISLIFLISLKYKNLCDLTGSRRNIIVGLTFGFISILGIVISHQIVDGFLDGKFSILVLVSLFFGVIPAMISGFTTLVYIILFASDYTGVMNYLLSAFFAILIPFLYQVYLKRHSLKMSPGHLVMLSVIVTVFPVLIGIAQVGYKDVYSRLGLAGSVSILFAFLFTYILGRVFLFEIDKQEKEQAMKEKNMELDRANQALQAFNTHLFAAESQLKAQNEQLAAADEEMKAQFEELVFSKAKIEEDENILRMILNAGQEAIWYYQVAEQRSYVSEQAYALLGYGPDEINLYQPILQYIHPDDLSLYTKADEDLRNGVINSYQIEYRVLGKDENYRWLANQAMAQFDDNNKLTRIAGALSSIQERKEKEEELYRLIYFDYLTGLPNRGYYAEEFRNAISTCAPNHKLALAYIDVDNLKKVNISKGHALGDQLLINTANNLKAFLGESTLLCRMGGDEFAVLLKENDGDDTLENKIDTIIDIISTPYIFHDTTIQLDSCIGVSLYPDDGTTYEELLKHADNALFRVKQSGQNKYLFFNSEMKKEAEEKLELESLLITALQYNEIEVHYQPIVESGTGKVKKAEALMRWKSKKLGDIPPVKFIPILEETGQIVPFGNHLMRQACLLNHQWNNLYGTDIITAVNISPFQLMQPDFADKVNRILAETGIRPENLELEITESIFIGDFKTIKDELNQLRELGIKISLDDFGTGYSSLNYLRSLNINTLKIDKTFVDDLLSSDNTSIIGSIISLAHDMGIEVVAEGVEMKEQKELLEMKHCDLFQGYYFYKPLPEIEISALLSLQSVQPLPAFL